MIREDLIRGMKTSTITDVSLLTDIREVRWRLLMKTRCNDTEADARSTGTTTYMVSSGN